MSGEETEPSIHEVIAATSSDEAIDVRPSVEDDPAAAAAKVASIIIGDGPESRPGDIDVDEEALERRINAKGRQKCKLFHLNDDEQAQAFADLCQKAEVDRTVRFIGAAKDLVDGIQHAVSVRWVEFDEPYEKVAKKARTAMVPEDRKRSLLDKMGGGTGADVGLVNDGVRCQGTTAKKTQCSRKRVDPTEFCRDHQPAPIKAVDMDEPPTSHTGLGTA